MKKIFSLFTVVLFSVVLFSCSDSKINEEKFYDLYKEILLIRKENEDTTVANPLVGELYKKFNYSQEKFKNDFLELSKDSKTFIQKIDSIRNVVNQTQ